jgi:hypothetical protein
MIQRIKCGVFSVSHSHPTIEKLSVLFEMTQVIVVVANLC